MASTLESEAPRLTNVLKTLNTLPRTGWLNRGVPAEDCETVGEHTDSVVEIVGQLSEKRTDINGDRAREIAKCHDYAEAIIGDLTPADDVSPAEKKRREDDAYGDFCRIDPVRGEEIRQAAVEYRDKTTPEARLVKDVDKYQRLKRAFKYQQRYPGLDFTGFRQDLNLINDPELKSEASGIIDNWNKWEARRRSHPLIIFVIGQCTPTIYSFISLTRNSGPPGVGKGTQCDRAAEGYGDRGVVHISAGDLLRRAAADSNSPFHDHAKSVLQGLTPAPAVLMLDLIRSASYEKGTRVVLLDGFPYNDEQYSVFCEKMSPEFHTIEFWASRQMLETRLLGRASSSGREDDKGNKQQRRLDDYEVRGEAIAKKLHIDSSNTYFKVNAEGSVQDVEQVFRHTLERLLPRAGMGDADDEQQNLR
ncbi:hypothetical protein CEP52_016996 [Fusarium oligoseptatum]|uniref:5'-deoxynucleotidase n=1 Tax=Fusarium oligoseptatum TaxID=2604345 RepID=A0A428RXZ2_9HYPO|nr:hypothetical protein CEP52_016996 [Fusarium oligoseptatum]